MLSYFIHNSKGPYNLDTGYIQPEASLLQAATSRYATSHHHWLYMQECKGEFIQVYFFHLLLSLLFWNIFYYFNIILHIQLRDRPTNLIRTCWASTFVKPFHFVIENNWRWRSNIFTHGNSQRDCNVEKYMNWWYC